jgi:hypothetical protein
MQPAASGWRGRHQRTAPRAPTCAPERRGVTEPLGFVLQSMFPQISTCKELSMMHPRLALIIVVCLSLIVPAAAAADADSDRTFLLSLAQDTSDGSPLTGVGTPAPSPRSCTVSRACGDGNTVMCTGNSSCVYSTKGVSCDGVETACPNYCRMTWSCQPECNFIHWCHSLKGDCGVTAEGCDGRPQRCLCPSTPTYPGGEGGGGCCSYDPDTGACPAYCSCCS